MWKRRSLLPVPLHKKCSISRWKLIYFKKKILKFNQNFKFVLLSNTFNKNFQLLSRSLYLRSRNCRQDIYSICAITPLFRVFKPSLIKLTSFRTLFRFILDNHEVYRHSSLSITMPGYVL